MTMVQGALQHEAVTPAVPHPIQPSANAVCHGAGCRVLLNAATTNLSQVVKAVDGVANLVRCHQVDDAAANPKRCS